MLQLHRYRALAAADSISLPWWVGEAVDGMADRIEELEHLVIGATEANEEMFEVLRFYAQQPNGDQARRITER